MRPKVFYLWGMKQRVQLPTNCERGSGKILENFTGVRLAHSPLGKTKMIKRILCCGDRYWVNIPVTEQVIAVCVNKYGKEIAIIHGGCAGADYEAGSAALKHELTVWVEPAKWSLHGNSAGPIRNRLMLSRYKPHLVIAFHSNISKSKGTKHMVDIAEKAGVPVVIISGRADAENIHDKLPESLCPEITD